MKRYGAGSGHTKIQHRLHSNEVMDHKVMDSEYARHHSGHDSGLMNERELDRRDPLIRQKSNDKPVEQEQE